MPKPGGGTTRKEVPNGKPTDESNGEPTNEPQHVRSPDKNINSDNMTQNTNIIFNYSTLVLTEPMNKLLNRALNFAVLPLKFDITQVLVDF